MSKLSDDDVERIHQLSAQGVAPLQIGTVMLSEVRAVLPKQVEYRWSILQRKTFLKNDDPSSSCRQHIESAANLEFLYESISPKALGFTTNIGYHISKSHDCAELVIDSTHKTNSSKFELFTVICKVSISTTHYRICDLFRTTDRRRTFRISSSFYVPRHSIKLLSDHFAVANRKPCSYNPDFVLIVGRVPLISTQRSVRSNNLQ